MTDMDTLYGGLAAPLRVIPVGRDDIAAADRPGAALVGLAREAKAAGAFPEELPDPDAERMPDPLSALDRDEDPDAPAPDPADMDDDFAPADLEEGL